ncbi:hypothetical protein MRX96_022340 [Rhipicephalus microplus]
MSGWAKNNVLADLQNGFRADRRLEHNLLVLIMARKKSRNLFGYFLDVTKACDSVPHESLFQRMAHVGMSKVWVGLMRWLYKDNSVITCFDGAQSRPVTVTRGLMQSCHLSPLCCARYMFLDWNISS